MDFRGLQIRDETGCCGCLFFVVVLWLTLIAAVGGYKLFKYVLAL